MSNYEINELSQELLERYAEMFKALSNPNRLRIFLELSPQFSAGDDFLANDEDVAACQLDMACRLKLAPSTVSHHIKELKNAGLVTMARQGRNTDIRVSPENLELIQELFKNFY